MDGTARILVQGQRHINVDGVEQSAQPLHRRVNFQEGLGYTA
jgi:hypothetical protein